LKRLVYKGSKYSANHNVPKKTSLIIEEKASKQTYPKKKRPILASLSAQQLTSYRCRNKLRPKWRQLCHRFWCWSGR